MLANPQLQNETGVYSGEASIREYTLLEKRLQDFINFGNPWYVVEGKLSHLYIHVFNLLYQEMEKKIAITHLREIGPMEGAR
jgi:hypothetical protein